MALTRLNNRSITEVTALPSGVTLPSGTVMPSGSVLQVKYSTYGTQVNNATATYIDLTSITITPRDVNSKFFLLANFSWSGRGVLNLFRNTTQLHSHSADPYVMWGYNQTDWNSNSLRTMVSVTALDTPSTTSSITYWVKFRSRSNTAVDSAAINEQTGSSTISNFTVMEIAG